MRGPPSRRDRGDSSVIGVALLIAVTVILAAVVGTLVFDVGRESGNAAPTASLSIDSDHAADRITLDHLGGEDLVGTEVRIQVTNESSGARLRFEPTSEEVLSVGDRLIVAVAESPDAEIDASSDAWGGTTASGNFPGISLDAQYTVQLIDLPSDRVIYESTVDG